jgi:hypothetical protein
MGTGNVGDKYGDRDVYLILLPRNWVSPVCPRFSLRPVFVPVFPLPIKKTMYGILIEL